MKPSIYAGGGFVGMDRLGVASAKVEYVAPCSNAQGIGGVIADLSGDGAPEIVFTTYGDPDSTDSGHLVILAADGAGLYDVVLENQGDGGGNGSGAPAAPTVADVDGDGQLEILVQTFDHGLDVYRVPGSGVGCVPWPTSRGGPLRMGAYSSNAAP